MLKIDVHMQLVHNWKNLTWTCSGTMSFSNFSNLCMALWYLLQLSSSESSFEKAVPA